jgi:hypothetical protein
MIFMYYTGNSLEAIVLIRALNEKIALNPIEGILHLPFISMET